MKAALACVAVAAVLVLAPGLRLAAAQPSIPTITDAELEQFEPAVRVQIKTALKAATSNAGPDTLAALGKILHAYEQFDRAAIVYTRLRSVQPDVVRWAYYLGLAQASAGRITDAVQSLREALRLDRHYLPLRVRLGDLLLAQNQTDESLQIYQAAVTEHPESALAHYGLGRAQSARGDVDRAVESYRRACELAPAFGAAHYALGLLYRNRGAAEEARTHLLQYRLNQAKRPPLLDPLANDIEAQKGGAYNVLEQGRQLRLSGRTREAVAAFEQALALKRDLVEAHVNLIAAFGSLGEFARAEQHFRQAIAVNADAPEAHYNFGLTLLAQRRMPDAALEFRRVLDIAPNHADAHNNLGYVLMAQERLDEAQQHFRAAVASNPQHRDAHYNLARILEAQGRGQEAVEHLRRTVAVDDERTAIFMFYLADACARFGKTDQAVLYAREARARATASGHADLVPHIDRLLASVGAGPKPQ